MGDFYTGPWHHLLGMSPILLAELIGLIIAFVLVRRHGKPAVLVVVATIVLLVLQISWPFLFELLYRQMYVEGRYGVDVIMFAGWSRTILDGLCWLLIITAVFIGRGGTPRQDAPAAAGGAPPPRPFDTHQHEGIDVNVKPVSKGLYLGSIIGSFILAWLVLIPGYVLILQGERNEEALFAGMGLVCFAYVPMIYGVVMLAILIFKMWAAIQTGTARTTPGKAVGFLFIPFFNFYWVFQAYWGWTVDYNRTIEQLGIAGPRAPQGVALTLCIFAVCAIIPVVGILLALVNMVLMIIFLNAAVNGVNAIAAASGAAGAPAPPATG